MNNIRKQIALTSLVIAAIELAAMDNPRVQSRKPIPKSSSTRSIGLFKNGLAYVKRTLTVEKPGLYMIADVPEPVYGTFWVESSAKVTVRSTTVETTEELELPSLSIVDDFAGREVTVHLKGENLSSPIKGTLLSPAPLKRKEWNRNYNPNPYGSFNGYSQGRPNMFSPPRPGRFLQLRTDKGVTTLDSSIIAYVESDAVNATRAVVKPALIFDVESAGANENGEIRVEISYLTKGMSWAASYLVDIQDERTMTILQKAVIKNELVDFNQTEIKLISGFPNIKFAHVVSPLSPRTNWSAFFQQLNQRIQPNHNVTSNVATQQAVAYNRRPGDADVAHFPGQEGEGVDIHYQSVGKLAMDVGDALALDVAKESVEYESVVLWDIPDNRQANGQYVNEYERRNNPEKYEGSLWDSLRFKNPFPFPMTTAAATFVKSGRFLGESISFWVNPGQTTVVKTTKALSVRAMSSEKEIPDTRERLIIFGRRYQKTQVEGTLTIKNTRKEPVTLLIKRQFSGELLNADGSPKSELREEGVYSVNKRNQLSWEIHLEPGEEKTMNYRYEVLVCI